MVTIRDYVKDLFKDVPKSDEKENIIEEIIQNLEEKVSDLIQEGKEEEDAINKAIVEFGEIDEIKKELIGKNENHLKRKKAWIYFGFSFWASVLISALSIFVNMYYTPKTIWFVYPIFAVTWWPLAMFFNWYKYK